jgi:uncharacterized Rmd1/YagE family protein
VGQPYAKRETEEARLRVDPAGEDRVEGGEILVQEATIEALQVVADVLGKSVVLGFYETSLAAIFDAVEPFAQGLRGAGRASPSDRDLLRYIGDTLLTQHQMVGRVAVGEKPDVLWEMPGLTRLFSRLEDEYELQERKLAVDRKLDLISRTVETFADLLHNKRALRVEWYIVVLIVIEIILTLYQLVFLGKHRAPGSPRIRALSADGHPVFVPAVVSSSSSIFTAARGRGHRPNAHPRPCS